MNALGAGVGPTWADQLAALAALGTAVLTLVLVLMAYAAWRTAKSTLQQAQRDSMEQTRPYVYAELCPGLSGVETFDLKITNVGKSSARRLTLDYDGWPDKLDDVSESLKKLFTTARTLPPGCSIRAVWSIDGQMADGTNHAGLGREGQISVFYGSNDPASPYYSDSFDVLIEASGYWPIGEAGPNPDGLNGDTRKFYLLGQALVRRVAELGR